MDIKYFKDIDTDAIYACVGPMAANALFRLMPPLAKEGQWEFVVPNSPTWDAMHQRIYRNPQLFDHYKVEEVLAALEARLRG